MIWFEVSFGYVRLMVGFVRQYVIPRTVFGRPGTRHGFVPRIGSSKVSVDLDDYTPVVEQLVLNNVTH